MNNYCVKIMCFFSIIILAGCSNSYALSKEWSLVSQTGKSGFSKYRYVYNCEKNILIECVSISVEVARIPKASTGALISFYAEKYIQDMSGLGHVNLVGDELLIGDVGGYVVTHELKGYMFKTVIFIKKGQVYYFTYSSLAEYYYSQLPSFDNYWLSIIEGYTGRATLTH